MIRFSIVAICTALAAHSPAVAQKAAESVLANSTVSVAIEPQLNDGRLVVKIAAQNRSEAAVPFGPANVSVSKPNGEAIALIPLARLIDDVRIAAGEAVDVQGSAAATASPTMPVTATGQRDVSGYTGGMAVAPDENVRRVRKVKRKASISKAEAERQIAALKAAVLQDQSVAPGAVAAGQVVTQKLSLAKGEDRLVHVRIRIAADEHGFTMQAPRE